MVTTLPTWALAWAGASADGRLPCTADAARYGPRVIGTRLYVGNLSHDSTAEMLRATFSEFGDVTDVQVVVDRYSGRTRGFAFITMATPEQAAHAAAKMNGATLDGRTVHVSEADPQRSGEVGDGGAERKR
jgi:cold-inducible RNA-binding protein